MWIWPKPIPAPLRWKPAGSDDKGYVNLLNNIQPAENVVVYATAYAKSPTARKAVVSVGSDDGIKVWINGKLAHGKNAARPAVAGEDEAPVELRAGWNEILLKITQGGGDWGFYFDLLDADKKPMTDIVLATRPR